MKQRSWLARNSNSRGKTLGVKICGFGILKDEIVNKSRVPEIFNTDLTSLGSVFFAFC